MFAKKNRLAKNRDFLKVFKNSRPVYTEHFAFRVTKRTPNPKPETQKFGDSSAMSQDDRPAKKLQANSYDFPSRFGLVVSNKIDKRSSRRNGLKRRIRAIIQGRLAELSNGCDVIIQVKRAFDYPYNYNMIEEEILFGLKKSGLI